MNSSQIQERVCAILKSRSTAKIDDKGYVPLWQDNLLAGINQSLVEADLQQGSGNELHGKFRALHSSSALAVNTFGPFRESPAALALQGRSGFTRIAFEKKLPTGLGGNPPNLDIWLEAEREVIAVESKFLEYLSPKKASFSDSYARAALPQADDAWWNVLVESKCADACYLDIAQLVKHALGILNHNRSEVNRAATLLYLFWEPVDAAEYEAFAAHRQQLRLLKSQVADSTIGFDYLSYPELWGQWDSLPNLQGHAAKLRQRYGLALR